MTLVVVCGVPGVGKTSVAEHLVDRLDATLLRTDVVRKELVDEPAYTDEEGRMVYEELLARAEGVLRTGEPVVLDGTFHEAAYRTAAESTADGAGVDCRFVKVECDPAVAERRIRAREDDESDADVEIQAMFRRTYDPLAVDHVTVDNSGSRAATRRQVDDLVVAPATGASE